MQSAPRLSRTFFERPTLTVARTCLGKRLTRLLPDGTRLSGIITETEAYIGTLDLACHARAGITPRTAVMFGQAGVAYVYFTYGMHWLLNFVCEAPGFPAAVLVRAVWAQEGLDEMRTRRGLQEPSKRKQRLSDGPGKLAQAFGVDGSANGLDLCAMQSWLWLEDAPALPESAWIGTARIGLGKTPAPWYALRWRFCVTPNALSLLRNDNSA